MIFLVVIRIFRSAFWLSITLLLILSCCNLVWAESVSYNYIRRFAGLGRSGDYCVTDNCYSNQNGGSLANGFRSISALTGDDSGNIFVSDTGNNRVVKIWANGTLESIVGTGVYSPFQYSDGTLGNETGLAGVYGLALDANQNFYFSELNGNRIRMLSSANNRVYTVAGVNPGLSGYSLDEVPALGSFISRPYAIQHWNNTRLYFAEFSTCRIRYVDEFGFLQTVAGTGGCAIPSEFSYLPSLPLSTTLTRPRSMWVNNAGSVFIAEQRGLVRKVENNTMRIIAGNLNFRLYRYGVAGTSASLGSIRNIFGDTQGNIYVSGSVSDIYRIDTRTEIIYKAVGASGGIENYDCGPANTTRIGFVDGLYWDKRTQNLYFSDVSYSSVRVASSFYLDCALTYAPTQFPSTNDTSIPSLEPSMSPTATASPTLFSEINNGNDTIVERPRYISTIAGVNDGRPLQSCVGSACYPHNHQANNNTLQYPYSVYVDKNGTIFIADTNNFRIVSVNKENVMTTIVGTGLYPAACCDGNDSLVTNVGHVYSITGDSDGVIYYAEYSESRIRAWFPHNNTVYTIAGVNPANKQGFTQDGLPLRGNRISLPYGVYVEDESRTLYFTDLFFCTVRMFPVDSTIVTTVVGSGNCQSNQQFPWQIGQDYFASSIFLSSLYYVWVNKAGEIYFTDSNNFVWKAYNGFARIFAGNGIYSFGSDYVPATVSSISYPRGITGDTNGNIYVVSGGHNLVKKIDPNGMMYRVAGGFRSGYIDCQDAIASSLSGPNGIAIDSEGNVYVADSGNYVIRKLSDESVCAPTPAPTVAPTGPSQSPTISPTAVPTIRPSWRPTTIKPSKRPSRIPTRRPTFSPSSLPSNSPSNEPSGKPTALPSSQPTEQPTALPSSQPSEQPTALPSSQPSGQPSALPSSQPSGQPSALPSSQPSGQPSALPSSQPSGQPSALPTSQPSSQPSIIPSIQPSSQPTCSPTDQPTLQPTSQLSSYPTTQPSSLPSRQPISHPTNQPTGQPSHIPTSQPSDSPSNNPSSQPTCSPSGLPSIQPSATPTCQPSTSPSSRPINRPTCQPSLQPSTSPSVLPTGQPSSWPSSSPTAYPTLSPTCQPSTHPSSQPSLTPTLKSKSPTVRPTTTRPSCQPTALPTFAIGIVGVYAVSSRMANDGLSCNVQLNVATNQASKTGVFVCSDVLSPISLVGGLSCSWTNSSTIKIVLSSTTVLGIGSSLGLIAGLTILRPIENFQGKSVSVAGRLVIVLPPDQPIQPIVTIKASNTISSCANWVVDLTSSVGNAGRSWTNYSVIVNILPAQNDNTSIILSHRLKEVISTDFPFTLPNYWFNAGTSYKIRIQLCNYLGGCGFDDVNLFVSNSSLSSPVVSILGSSEITSFVNRSIVLSASAFVPLCYGQQRTLGLIYSWSIYQNSVPVQTTNRAADPSTLVLAPFTLAAGNEYRARVVVKDSRSQLTAQAEATITTLVSSIVAKISPSVASVIGIGQSVTLDASSSFDPDSPSAILSFTWTSSLISSVTGLSLSNTNNPITLQVTDKSLTSVRSVAIVTGAEFVQNVSALVKVTISSSAKSAVSLTSVFKILSEPIPIVTITTAPESVVNIDATKSVSLVGSVIASSSTSATWSLTGVTSTALSKMVAGGSVTFPVVPHRATPISFFLLPSSLATGATYNFVLSCGKASISLSVSTNYPPYGGSLDAFPNSGYSLQTNFVLSTKSWIDIDLPLQYSFKFYSESTAAWLSVQSVSPASFCSSILPTGPSGLRFLVNVSVVAIDSFGATSLQSAKNIVYVQPVPATQMAGIITSLLGNASSASVVQQVVSVGSAALNVVNCTGVNTSYCALSLHRNRCLSTSFTCGPCFAGYLGVEGDSNEPCFVVNYNRRRLTEEISCTSNAQCESYQVCNSNSKVCEDRQLSCPQSCSGHGSCSFISTVTMLPVSRCSVVATNCTSMCICVTGYAGKDCSRSSSDLEQEQSVRANMLHGLEKSLSQTNLDPNAVTSIAKTVGSLITSKWSLSESAVENVATVSQALVSASLETTIAASSFEPLLAPWDYALNNLVNTSLAGNLSFVFKLVNSFASLSATDALPDAAPVSSILSMYRVATQAISISSGSFNGSISVPSTEMEQSQQVAKSNVRIYNGNESFESASAISVQLAEFQQSLIYSSLPVESNVVSISASVKNADGSLSSVPSFEVEIMHNRFLSLNYSLEDMTFDVNCTQKVENFTHVCPGSNVTLQVHCDGQREGTWRKHCPIPQPACQGLTKDEMFGATKTSMSEDSRAMCQTKSVTTTSTICVCEPSAQQRRRSRRRRLSVNEELEEDSDYLAVMVMYVSHQFVDTFEATSSLKADIFEKSYIVISLYLSLWTACGIFMIGMYYKGKANDEKKRQAAIKKRNQSKMQKGSVISTNGGAPIGSSRRRGGIGASILPQVQKQEEAVKGEPVEEMRVQFTKQVLREKLLSYIESVIPKVFDEKPALWRLFQEMGQNHVYAKLVVEGLSERKSYNDVFQMMTTFTVLMFLLALMYDLQYPSDDGSCPQYANESDCLKRKSLLDYSQTFCVWTVLQETNDRHGEIGTCRFNANVNISFESAAICAVVTSWFSSILTRPLEYVFSILNAPSIEDIHNDVKATSAFEKLHASVVTGVRRPSILSNRAVHSIVPGSDKDGRSSNALILHTTRIPEDAHTARKEIRMAVQELENQSTRLSLSRSHVANGRSLSAVIMANSGATPSSAHDSTSTSAFATPGDIEQLTISPHAILRSLQQQRNALTGAKLAEFDTAWYFVLHYDEWRAEKSKDFQFHLCGSKTKNLPLTVDDFIVQLMTATITSAQRENKVVDGLTDVEAGLHILQTFVRDILGNHTSIAKIFQSKACGDFYRTNAVSKRIKWCAVIFLLALNVFCLFYSVLRGYVKGLRWQCAFAVSALVQLATEVLFFETLETVWVDFVLPNFAHEEMRRCHAILKRMVDSLSELMESESLQMIGMATPDMETGDYLSHKDKQMSILFNVPRHFYVSHSLAHRHPTLIESMMVLSYESYLPVGLETGNRPENEQHNVGFTQRIGMWFISFITFFSATFLAFIAAVPFEFHRMVIRFFGPFVVGGLLLLWAYISVNVLFLALFFGGIGTICLYLLYVVWQLYFEGKQSQQQVQQAPQAALSSSSLASVVPVPDVNTKNAPLPLLPLQVIPSFPLSTSMKGQALSQTAKSVGRSLEETKKDENAADVAQILHKNKNSDDDKSCSDSESDSDDNGKNPESKQRGVASANRRNRMVSFGDDSDGDSIFSFRSMSFHSVDTTTRSRHNSSYQEPFERVGGGGGRSLHGTGLRRRFSSTGSQSAHSLHSQDPNCGSLEPMYFAEELPDDVQSSHHAFSKVNKRRSMSIDANIRSSQNVPNDDEQGENPDSFYMDNLNRRRASSGTATVPRTLSMDDDDHLLATIFAGMHIPSTASSPAASVMRKRLKSRDIVKSPKTAASPSAPSPKAAHIQQRSRARSSGQRSGEDRQSEDWSFSST